MERRVSRIRALIILLGVIAVIVYCERDAFVAGLRTAWGIRLLSSRCGPVNPLPGSQ